MPTVIDLIVRGVVAGVVVVLVTVLARHDNTRFGALILTLPLVSIIAFISTWQSDRELDKIMSLSRDTLILVPLGLPFFIPLAFAKHWGLSFWPAVAIGVVAAGVPIALWIWLGPK